MQESTTVLKIYGHTSAFIEVPTEEYLAAKAAGHMTEFMRPHMDNVTIEVVYEEVD